MAPKDVAGELDLAARKRVDWQAVAVFYVIACAISWPLFWLRDYRPEAWAAWAAPDVVKSLTPALGPLVAGIAARIIFRRSHVARISLAGSSLWRSLVFAAVFVVAMAVVGLQGSHLNGFFYAFAFMAYGFGEETGWRGFLQDAVWEMPEWQRVAVVGALWGVWHITVFTQGGAAEIAQRVGLMAAVWLAGSFGMGRAMGATRSLTVAAMLHVTFNLFRSIPPATAAEVVGPCVVAWVILFRGWPRPADRHAAAKDGERYAA